MCGTTILSPTKNILKQIYPVRGIWGTLSTSAPKKQRNNDLGDGERPIMDGKVEPIVAFNKPPLPPILGPFVVLSLLEMGSSSNDD